MKCSFKPFFKPLYFFKSSEVALGNCRGEIQPVKDLRVHTQLSVKSKGLSTSPRQDQTPLTVCHRHCCSVASVTHKSSRGKTCRDSKTFFLEFQYHSFKRRFRLSNEETLNIYYQAQKRISRNAMAKIKGDKRKILKNFKFPLLVIFLILWVVQGYACWVI